jgi:hypothetical protein
MQHLMIRPLTLVFTLSLLQFGGCGGQTDVPAGALDLPDPSGSGSLAGEFESGTSSGTPGLASEVEGDPSAGVTPPSQEEENTGNELADTTGPSPVIPDAGGGDEPGPEDTTLPGPVLGDTSEGCMPPNIIDCYGECASTSSLGDGDCDGGFDCGQFDYDYGDCGWGIEEDAGATEGASDAVWTPDDAAWTQDDVATSVPDATSDCGGEYIMDCYGECSPSWFLGDGSCDYQFNCSQFDYDSFDCQTDEPPSGGACTNGDDMSIIAETDITAVATEYAYQCLTDADIGACTAAGVTGDTGLSTGCALCYAEQVVCGAENCLGECISDSEAQACVDCRNENCVPLFEPCSGIPSSTGGITGAMTCNDDEVISCNGKECIASDWLNDDYCDADLNCLQYSYDMGDCEP